MRPSVRDKARACNAARTVEETPWPCGRWGSAEARQRTREEADLLLLALLLKRGPPNPDPPCDGTARTLNMRHRSVVRCGARYDDGVSWDGSKHRQLWFFVHRSISRESC